jgi:hypothetical protein
VQTSSGRACAAFGTPSGFVKLEMFKFRSGKLYRAEVVHADTNYHASSLGHLPHVASSRDWLVRSCTGSRIQITTPLQFRNLRQ